MLADMHCHWGFDPDPLGAAASMEELDICGFVNTVGVEDFDRLSKQFASSAFCRVGLGMHPWTVNRLFCDEADESACSAGNISLDAHLELFDSRLHETDFVGEVGLDFSAKHKKSKQTQLAILEHVLAESAKQGNKVISIHCVHAAGTLLDCIKRSRACDSCACILHGFAESEQSVQRAQRLGCWFSVGSRTVSSEKGRAALAAMPLERILLESDAPAHAGECLQADSVRLALEESAQHAAAMHHVEVPCVEQRAYAASLLLLDL